MVGREPDVLVIGAGVFGTWTALALHRAGRDVAVLEMAEPGHPAASSGGETRIARCMYGTEEVYTEWAWRSLSEWRALSERTREPLFRQTGVLWMYRAGDAFAEASAEELERRTIPVERLGAEELRARYPALRVEPGDLALLEPRAGALQARRAVERLAGELRAAGVTFLRGRAAPIRAADAADGALDAVETVDGRRVSAGSYVVAAGPWLDRLCPDAMAGRLFVTRQDVLFFEATPADTGALPIWADMPFYGFPSLDGRGFKIAHDRHGPRIDPDAVSRRVSADAEPAAREFLERRFPSLAGRAVVDGRVCQYANSSNGDFLVDRHPGLDNVWLVGCGSGHGFKHGPALGAHVADLVLGRAAPLPRLGLAVKQTEQARAIQ